MSVEDPREGVLAQVGAAWVSLHKGEAPEELLWRVVEEILAVRAGGDPTVPTPVGDEFEAAGYPVRWLTELGNELTGAVSLPAPEHRGNRSHRTGGRHG